MATLRIDKWPKNGKTSMNPKLPSITGKENPKGGAGKDMPQQFNKKPALATANTMGQGHVAPKFGIGASTKENYAKGPTVKTLDGIGGTKAVGSSAMRHPASHAAFHALGAPKGGKY